MVLLWWLEAREFLDTILGAVEYSLSLARERKAELATERFVGGVIMLVLLSTLDLTLYALPPPIESTAEA